MLSRVSSPAAFATLVLILVSPPVLAQEPAASPGSGICVAVMAATMTGVDGDAAAAGTAVRDLFVTFLTGPSIHPLPLESRLRVQAVEEAKQKNCAYFINVSLSRKRGGGGGGLGAALGRAAGTAAWYVPGAAGAGGVVRGVSVATAQVVGDLASSTRAKDELKIEWSLTAADQRGRSLSPRSEKLKARSDGEDLLTPLVQRASETVAETVLRK
jgi:hypothetical protein